MALNPYVPKDSTPIDTCDLENPCSPDDRFVRAMVSNETGNTIQQLPDGIYVPEPDFTETMVTERDASVRVEEVDSLDGYRSFAVGTRISTESGNMLELREDGLFVMVDIPDAAVPILLYQGSLVYNPLTTPGTGSTQLDGPTGVGTYTVATRPTAATHPGRVDQFATVWGLCHRRRPRRDHHRLRPVGEPDRRDQQHVHGRSGEGRAM